MADEESDSDDSYSRLRKEEKQARRRICDKVLEAPEFTLNAEYAHKRFSALMRPRKANILMAVARRPELEKLGMSPGEIGALRRTGAVRAQ
jgi:hypothetical protein